MKLRTDRNRRGPGPAAALAVVVLLATAGCAAGTNGAPSPTSETTKHEGSKGSPQPVQALEPEPAQAVEPAPDGGAFTDPEGRYTLTVPADWEPRHGLIGPEVEVWFIAEPDAAFTPNLNVMMRHGQSSSPGRISRQCR